MYQGEEIFGELTLVLSVVLFVYMQFTNVFQCSISGLSICGNCCIYPSIFFFCFLGNIHLDNECTICIFLNGRAWLLSMSFLNFACRYRCCIYSYNLPAPVYLRPSQASLLGILRLFLYAKAFPKSVSTKPFNTVFLIPVTIIYIGMLCIIAQIGS
jgi:hypothetical protein